MTQDLHTILGFTDADLDANRSGEITDNQRTNLKNTDTYDLQSLILGLGIILIIVVPICGVCAILFNIPVILSSLSSTIIAMGIGAVGIITALVFYANWRGVQERSALPDVSMTEDQSLDFERKQKGSHEIYWVIAGDQSFQVSYEIYSGLQTFERNKPDYFVYRIYHTPHNPRILSIELVNSGPVLS